jgi:hypothetical protein
MVYRSTITSRWLVSYRSGNEPEFTDAAVKTLVNSGMIHSCYSDCPDDAYWLDATVDVEAAMAERLRRKSRKDAQ